MLARAETAPGYAHESRCFGGSSTRVPDIGAGMFQAAGFALCQLGISGRGWGPPAPLIDPRSMSRRRARSGQQRGSRSKFRKKLAGGYTRRGCAEAERRKAVGGASVREKLEAAGREVGCRERRSRAPTRAQADGFRVIGGERAARGSTRC